MYITYLEIERNKIDLSKRGCIPAMVYDAKWHYERSKYGISAVAHNYITRRGAFIKVYDVYVKGVYEASFRTQKAALGYMGARERGFNLKKGE